MKRFKRKDLLLLPNKLTEKVPNFRNAKEHYELFLIKKNKIRKTTRNSYL